MELTIVKHRDVAATDTKKDVKNLICSSINANNNKFWRATLYECQDGTWKVHVHWGRVGDNGQEETRTFDDEAGAAAFIQKKVKEKTKERKGKESYSVAAVIDADIPLVRPNGKSTSDIAHHARKISSNPTITKLVDYLVKVNVHSIVSDTTMTYNATTGLFSTPLGIVTDSAISEARDLLSHIGDFVAKQESIPHSSRQWNDGSYTKLLNQYLRLIPQKVGRRLDPATLYPNLDAVKAQNDILDSLSASLDMVSKKPDVPAGQAQPEEEKVFEITLEPIHDQDEIDRIRKFYKKTLDRSHSSAHLEVANVYSIDIGPVSSAYEKKGKPLGNIMELWHGTRPGNILSIFKKGLIIPPSNASHCTGRLFGNGVYASDISTKSLNYANPRGWGKSFGNDSVFMFMVHMAMGKVYHPYYGERLPKKGYDSTWAKGDLQFPGDGAGVRHNEMIVYSVDQVNLTHLIEFKPPAGGRKATRNW